MPEPIEGVKPPVDPALNPQPAPAGVKPPEVKPDPAGVKPPGEPTDPGVKTDPALLLISLKEEREKRRTAEAKTEQMKQVYGDKMQWDANGNPVAPAQPSTNATDMQKKIDELWESDPRKGVQAEIMMGFQWFDQVNTGLDMQRSEARGKYPDFDKYESQAMSYVRTLPLDQRAKPGVVELAYLVQKGQSSNTIYEQAREDIIKKLQAGESIQGLQATQAQAAAPGGKQPTADEAKVAEAMNIPIAEYMKNRK